MAAHTTDGCKAMLPSNGSTSHTVSSFFFFFSWWWTCLSCSHSSFKQKEILREFETVKCHTHGWWMKRVTGNKWKWFYIFLVLSLDVLRPTTLLETKIQFSLKILNNWLQCARCFQYNNHTIVYSLFLVNNFSQRCCCIPGAHYICCL